MRTVYLDHAAATPLAPQVHEAMRPFLTDLYGNPSSFHTVGKRAKDAIDEARSSISGLLGCHADELLFTSGGTESDNLAILGVCRSAGRGHVVTTTIEHQAVLEAVGHLEKKEGFEATYVPVDKFGVVDPDAVVRAIRPDTLLVSVMYANNEIGTIQPIAEIGKAIQKMRQANGSKLPYFHTDACQAAGALDLTVDKLHVDLMTLNGSKIYGPKGVGLLYAKRGIKLAPLQFGGAQEKGVRPGTENIAGIIGLSTALSIAHETAKSETARLVPLRDRLVEGILRSIPKTRLNGHPTERLPNNANVSIMDIEGEAMVLYLDAQGVYASTGSACTSASLDPSHVILALGLPYEVAHGSVRFTLGRSTTSEDIDYVLAVLPPLVEKLRAISPVRVDEKYYLA